jgi:survival of motor neuron protein-interacting protein 1
MEVLAAGMVRYTREELEALRGAPSSEAQALRWGEALAALAAAGFSGDYEGLLASDEPVNRRGRRASGGGRKAAAAPQFSGTALFLLLAGRPSSFLGLVVQ